MSLRFEYNTYGHWLTLNRESGYLCIGRPVYGAEHLGNVTCLGLRDFGLEYFATEKPCVGSDGREIPSHTADWDYDVAGCCVNCGLVVAPRPPAIHEFAWDIDGSGRLIFRTGPYEADVHGPFGADTLEDLEAQMATFSTEWTASHGPGPWYAWHDEYSPGPAIAVYTVSVPVTKQSENLTGPFDSIEAAYRAANEMKRTRRAS